jgi:uncharacterized surface protein with fasciclin (FAS1) repeats
LVSYSQRVMDLMGDKSVGLSSALDQFFASASGLAADPASTVQRGSFLRSSDGLASRFAELSGQLDLIGEETSQALNSAAGQFNTLIAAVKAAGLVDALSGRGPFTVFAPTDAAFKKLPPATLKALLKPENRDKLRAILLYHVVGKAVTSDQVPAKPVQVPTLNPSASLKVQMGKGFVHVNGIRVVKADIATDNGVIHVINSVLIPK